MVNDVRSRTLISRLFLHLFYFSFDRMRNFMHYFSHQWRHLTIREPKRGNLGGQSNKCLRRRWAKKCKHEFGVVGTSMLGFIRFHSLLQCNCWMSAKQRTTKNLDNKIVNTGEVGWKSQKWMLPRTICSFQMENEINKNVNRTWNRAADKQ